MQRRARASRGELLFVLILLSLAAAALPAGADPTATLTITHSNFTAGSPTTFGWSGTLAPPSTGFGRDCSKLEPPRWGISMADAGFGGWFDNATGNAATFTVPYGGWYRVGVSIRYADSNCEGGGSGFALIRAGGPLVALGSTPDPAIVDRDTLLWVAGNIPNDATVKWTFADGTPGQTWSPPLGTVSLNFQHTFKTPGTYDARVTISNPSTSETPIGVHTQEVRIVVKPDPPTVSAGFTPSSPKAGDVVQFNGNIDGGERDRKILWNFGDGTTSTEQNPAHAFAAADDYSISLTVTNAWGSAKWTYDPFEVLPAAGGSPPEKASFTWTPPSPVTNQVVTFNDDSKGAITRWRWNFDDGSPEEYAQNPAHIFTQFGRKNVELWVSNRYGRKGIIFFVDVLRHDVPPLAGFTFAPFHVRVGEPVQFTDTSFGATSWQWDLGEDGATSTQPNPTYTYRTSGQKSVTLKVANAFGTDTVTKFFPCDEGTGTQLAANFTWSPQNPDPGEPVSFTDLSTGSPEKWSWVVSDGAQSHERNWTHTFLQPGEYAVSLRVDKGSETKILVQIVKVGSTAAPIPNFTFSPGKPKPGEEVRFVNLSQNATSYLWNFGDGTTSTEVDPKHTFAEAKRYRVELTATKGNASKSITKDVTVSAEEDPPPVAHFTVAPNPAQVGKPVRFTDTSTGHPTEWLWEFGYANATSRQQNPEHAFPFEGTFLVTLRVTNGRGTSAPLTLPVVVKKDALKPEPDFGWLPGTPAANEVVTFTDKSANDPKSWKWTFGDGGGAQGSVVTHAFAKAGSFTVTLVVSNDAGEATVSRTVVVTEPKLEADFTFDPPNPKVGDRVRFIDKSKGQPDSWTWTINGIDAGHAREAQRAFYLGGDHYVELQVRRGAEQSRKEKKISVAAPPVASFNIRGRHETGATLVFEDASTGNPTRREWFINSRSVSTGASFSHKFTESGSYSIKLFVENAIGSDSITSTLSLTSDAPERPKIRTISPEYGPCFFSLMPLTPSVEVDVDWRAQLPGNLALDINGVREGTSKAEGAKTILKLDTRKLDFSDKITENRLLFTAQGSLGVASDPAALTFFSVKTPGYLQIANVRRDITEIGRMTFLRGLQIPPKAYEGTIKLPQMLGGYEFGLKKTQFKLEELYRTDCTISRKVEVTGALVLGKGFGGLKGFGTSETKLSRSSGARESQLISFGIDAFAGFEAKSSLLEIFPGMTATCALPFVSSVCDVAEVKLEVTGSIGGVLEFTIDDEGIPQFKSGSNTGAFEPKWTGALDLGSAKFEVFGGGKGTVKYGRFDDSPFIRKATVGVEYGWNLIWFGSQSGDKYEVSCTYEPDKEFACGFDPAKQNVRADSVRAMQPVAPLSRDEEVEAEGEAPVLLRNVTPLAAPHIAAHDDRAILVYLGENESAGASLQRLDVRAMRRSGADWDAPHNVTSDSAGDFNPAVVLAPNGRAIVAWERIGNPTLSYADVPTLAAMPALLRTVEIAVSMNDASSETWSSPAVLTANDLYDHEPALATLPDGRTILAWLREPADGKSAQQLVARVLQGETWSPEVVIANDLRGATTLALAAHESEAQLVVAHGGDLALFVYRNDAWSARVDVTKDAEHDHAPAVIDDNGAARLYWSRAGAVLTRTLPDGPIETVRALDGRSGVATPLPLVRPGGAQMVVWSSGDDLRAVLRDSETKQWSSDIVLTDDSTSHASLGAFFTADATLHLVSLATSTRTDLMAFDTTMRIDLAARGETLRAEPRQPSAGEMVTIALDAENAGTLPVRNAIVELRRGDAILATTTIAGDWMPGESKTVALTTTYDPATPQLTIVVDARNDAEPANNVARFSFANRAPAACFQASAGSGGSPLAVAFDAACSGDDDGAIARYAWAFGEEGSASGKSASHAFTTPGTHTVVLTVTDDMGATSARTMTIDVASAIDWRVASREHSLYLSVVGRANGVNGSFFVSDVAILNTDAERDLTIDAVYLPDGRAEAYHRELTLRGGELLHARDVITQLFSATNGTGSVRLDLSHPHAVAVARTYNDQPSGTAGFSNEALARSASLANGETGVILQHWLPGYRTNIGFTEVGGESSVVTASAFDEKGALLGSEQYVLGAYEHKQINGRALFQNRGRIEIVASGGAVLAYTSTVDGSSGDPIYQVPERASAATLLIPVVAHLAGANNTTWRSDVRLFNPGPAQQAALELRTGSGTFTTTVDVGAGETIAFDDVIPRAFPQISGSAAGALHIHAAAPILASSRTFNVTPGGTFGLYVPARSHEHLLGEGETAWLVQLQENERYRCNLGITSFEGNVQVRVRAFDARGTTLATKTYGVAAGQNVQIGRVFADMGAALPLDAGGLEVTVTEGRAFVYASINDNRTGDGTFVEARR